MCAHARSVRVAWHGVREPVLVVREGTKQAHAHVAWHGVREPVLVVREGTEQAHAHVGWAGEGLLPERPASCAQRLAG